MVQIITYTLDVKDKKEMKYARKPSDSEKKNHIKMVYAEEELDALLKEGWKIESATVSEAVLGSMGYVDSSSKLTVIVSRVEA